MKKRDGSLSQVRIIYVLTTIFLVILSIYTFIQIRNLIDSSNLVNHSSQVKKILQKVSSTITEAEISEHGFLLTGDKSLIQKRDVALDVLCFQLLTLDSLIKENPKQIQNLKKLNIAIGKKVTSVGDISVKYTPLQIHDSIRVNVIKGMAMTDSIKQHIDIMAKSETRLFELQTQKYAQLSFLTPLFIVLLFLGALLILLASYVKINTSLNHSNNLHKEIEKIEKQFELVVEASPYAMLLINHEGFITLVNKQAENLFGYERNELIGKKLTMLIPERFHDKHFNHTNKFFKASEMRSMGINIDVFCLRKNGKEVQVEIGLNPIETSGSRLILASVMDISKRVAQEGVLKKQNMELHFQNEEREKQAAELTVTNKELQLFAHISSHDLQEPLRKLQIAASRISEKDYNGLSDKGKDQLKKIQDAAAQMQELLEDLIGYARANNNNRKFENTDLDAIVKAVIGEFKEKIEEKHIIIEADHLCQANIIPFQFRQLMYNIIGNAIKFSRADVQPRIVIKCKIIKGSEVNNKKLLPENRYCHLSVMDNGIGFEPEYSEKIFEVFQRLHGKEKYKGTGIGLAIAKKIVENHNGIIVATGKLNEGATFNIYIPSN